MGIKGRVSPCRFIRNGDDILMSCEESRLERRVRALEGEDETVSVDLFNLGVLVAVIC